MYAALAHPEFTINKTNYIKFKDQNVLKEI